jgi:hypothetical protein
LPSTKAESVSETYKILIGIDLIVSGKEFRYEPGSIVAKEDFPSPKAIKWLLESEIITEVTDKHSKTDEHEVEEDG